MKPTAAQTKQMALEMLHAQHGFAVRWEDLNDEEQGIVLSDANEAAERVLNAGTAKKSKKD